jgi:hypothetical protein
MTQKEQQVVKISLDQANNLANINDSLKWSGWTLIHTTPNKMGWAKSNGLYDRSTDSWYVAKRFQVQDDGLYHIPKSVYHGLQH